MKNSSDITGNRTHGLSACSAAPQPCVSGEGKGNSKTPEDIKKCLEIYRAQEEFYELEVMCLLYVSSDVLKM
jgi:hypothetical protein